MDSERASAKFRKIISLRIISKFTVNRKDKPLARTELRHRHLPWKLPRIWETILNGVFQKFVSTDKNIFEVGKNVTSIASIDAFTKISGNIFMRLSWRVRSLLEYLLVKFRFLFLHLRQSLFLIKLQDFNLNGNDRVSFYFQAVRKLVLVKLQAFTINGSDGVCGGACFYRHVLVACF